MGKANRHLIVGKNIYFIKNKQFHESQFLTYSGWGKTSEKMLNMAKNLDSSSHCLMHYFIMEALKLIQIIPMLPLNKIKPFDLLYESTEQYLESEEITLKRDELFVRRWISAESE